jgi:hypothetical protein
MKKMVLSCSLLVAMGASAQYVNIPDANFKAYLLANAAINTNADSQIETNEATTFNGQMNCANLNIFDLTGIEAFTGTFSLNCAGNQLTTLDLSANVNMTGHLHVEGNVLTSIVMPNSTNLTQFTYSGNNITSLDLTNTPNITTMWGLNNPLASIDLSNSSALQGFNIDGNSLTTIDLSNLTNLQWISTSLSALTALDISMCPVLNNVYCQDSPNLASLNMANGNNMNFPPNWFVATNCPSLTCVEVDMVAFANAVWTTAVDPGVTFSTNCGTVISLAISLTIQGQGGATTITTQDGTLQMVPTILPVAAQSQTIFWGIAVGSSLATIDAAGLITAVDNGVVTIGALTSDGSNISANADITISNQVLGMESIVDAKFTVSPNPATTHIVVQTDEEVEAIRVYSSQGRLVFETNELSFSVEQFEGGMYTIVMETEENVSVGRFLKL